MPAVVCGFGAAVLTTIPGIKNVGCCLIVPAAAALSLFLYKKTNHIQDQLKANTGLVFGFFTGLVAAFFSSFFDILITYITHTNELVETFPQTEQMLKDMNLGGLADETLSMVRQIIADIKTKGFSPIYSFGIFVSNSITFSIFGIIGGLLGLLFINRKTNTR